jgi:hypothetical protein
MLSSQNKHWVSENWSLLTSPEEWELYKEKLANTWGCPVQGISWGNGPTEYPCLVATVFVDFDHVYSAFVYKSQAILLLTYSSTPDASISPPYMSFLPFPLTNPFSASQQSYSSPPTTSEQQQQQQQQQSSSSPDPLPPSSLPSKKLLPPLIPPPPPQLSNPFLLLPSLLQNLYKKSSHEEFDDIFSSFLVTYIAVFMHLFLETSIVNPDKFNELYDNYLSLYKNNEKSSKDFIPNQIVLSHLEGFKKLYKTYYPDKNSDATQEHKKISDFEDVDYGSDDDFLPPSSEEEEE